MRHPSKEELVLHYYGERDQSAHLRFCAECRQNFEPLRTLLDACRDYPAPERPADYEQRVWSAVRPAQVTVKSRFPGWRIPAFAAAMAATIVLAFLAGRISRQPMRPAPVFSEVASRNILQAALTDYIEQSELLLIELSHVESGKSTDIPERRQRARDLLGESRLYRQTATFAGDKSTAAVLEDLERVLLAIAHSPSTTSASELRNIRRAIDEQGLIFKLRVLDLNLRPTKNL